MQALKTSQDGVSDPGGGVVELVASYPPCFCDEEDGLALEGDGEGVGGRGSGVHEAVEGGAEEDFGRAVVGGCVEGFDAEGDGAGDDVAVGHGQGVRDILVVEGCGAEEEWGQGGRDGRVRFGGCHGWLEVGGDLWWCHRICQAVVWR